MAIIAVPAIAYYASLRPPLITFEGVVPQGRFIPLDAFERKSWINLSLPGGKKLVYPRTEKLEHKAIDHSEICGYWEPEQLKTQQTGSGFVISSRPFAGRTSEPMLRVGGKAFALPLSYREDASAPTPPAPAATTTTTAARRVMVYRAVTWSSAQQFKGKPLIPLPYVADEKYSRAELEIDGTIYRIKLPVKKELKTERKTPSEVVAGAYTIRFQPQPRITSFANREFMATITGPERKDMSVNLLSTYTSSGFSWSESLLMDQVRLGTPFAVRLSEHQGPNVEVNLLARKARPMKLVVKRVKGATQLITETGHKVHPLQRSGAHLAHIRNPIQARSLQFAPYISIPQARVNEVFKDVPNGGKIDAEELVQVNVGHGKVKLDIPIPPSPGPGTASHGPGRLFIYSTPGGGAAPSPSTGKIGP